MWTTMLQQIQGMCKTNRQNVDNCKTQAQWYNDGITKNAKETCMKKLHIILLEEPTKSGTPDDTLTVYVSRFKTRHEAMITMHLQGVLPKYSIVSHTVVPAHRTLLEMWFPSLGVIKHTFGKLSIGTFLKFWIGLRIKKIFSGSVRKRWNNIGEYDTTTKKVYPTPDGETLA